MESQRGAQVVCSEPRRIAATSLARHVAQERGENVGESIGYAIKGDHQAPRHDRGVTFVTAKVALHMLARGDCKTCTVKIARMHVRGARRLADVLRR